MRLRLVALPAILLSTSVLCAQATPPKEIKAFARTSDGHLEELVKEIPYELTEHDTMSRPLTIMYRLQQPAAKVRVKAGSAEFLFQFPKKLSPNALNLLRMVHYMRFRMVVFNWYDRDIAPYEINFKSRQTPDGWIITSAPLPPGEYCFSPKMGNDMYCFGVDK